MKRKRKPVDMGLWIRVIHPDSMGPETHVSRTDVEMQDGDGFSTSFEVDEMRGESLVQVQVRRGISGRVAAERLRIIADALERQEPNLLSLRRGFEGFIIGEAIALCDAWSECFDDGGNLVTPDAGQCRKETEGNAT